MRLSLFVKMAFGVGYKKKGINRTHSEHFGSIEIGFYFYSFVHIFSLFLISNVVIHKLRF